MAQRIGILNSGGDCPGINAVIASIVKLGARKGHQFYGFERGWEGILNPPVYRELDAEAVKGISWLGGTILKTANSGRFAGKVGSGDPNQIPESILAEAKHNLEALAIDGLIVIGGDGTLHAATQLAAAGVNIVGVPKTIDNDLAATDKTFGHSSAVDEAVSAFDKIHTTATSHERTFIIECMGRNTGWITLNAGLAGGANAILLPEFTFTVADLVSFIRSRQQDQRRSTIIAIAEGAQVTNQKVAKATTDTAEVLHGGVSELLTHAIDEQAPGEFELRNVILGHTQRGGHPNAEDRTLAKRYGAAAMDAFEAGEFGRLVCLRSNVMTSCSLSEATKELKYVTTDSYQYRTARELGVFLHSD